MQDQNLRGLREIRVNTEDLELRVAESYRRANEAVST